MHQQKGGKGGYFHCLLSVQLTECRPVDGGGEERGRERERWRVGGGWSAVFSRRSFLCVGLMAPSGGRVPQSNLLSPQNTLCYKTHTPSGTDSALNFLPVILAAGQRKKQLPNSERDGEDNHSPLRSRVNNHAFMVQERCCVRAEERG